MIRLTPLIALPLLAIAPTQAQDLSGPLGIATSETPPADCRAAFKMMAGTLSRTSETRIEESQDSCRATNFEINLGGYMAYTVDDASITMADLFNALVGPDLYPRAVLEINGLRPVYVGQPLVTYISNLGFDGFDIYIDLESNADAKQSTLHRGSIDAGQLGSISFSSRLSNFVDSVDIELEDMLQPEARLDYLDIKLHDSGLFRLYAFPGISSFLPYGEEPRPIVASAQASAIAMINGLPIADATKTAAANFINAFPDPKGQWHLRIEAPDLPLTELDVNDPMDLIGLLDKVEITMAGPDIAE